MELIEREERDACAKILWELRKLSPKARENWLKYQLSLCDQQMARERKAMMTRRAEAE